MVPKIGVCLSLALLFGLVTGHAGALTDSDQSMQRWSGFKCWWYGLLSCPGGAGEWIVNCLLLNGADWQGGEAWAHLQAVVFWNGLFWLATSRAAALPIYLVTEKSDRQAGLPPPEPEVRLIPRTSIIADGPGEQPPVQPPRGNSGSGSIYWPAPFCRHLF